MSVVFTNPRPQFFDSIGKPLVNGSIGFYYDDGTTLKAIYSDSSKTTPVSNPAPLTDGGMVRDGGIWLGDGEYTIVVRDRFDRILYSITNIQGDAVADPFILKTLFVNNLASLRNLTVGLYDLVYINGYYTKGDGGQGFFYYDASSNEVDDGGAYITPIQTPTNGRWVRIFDGDTVYSKQWGAIDTGDDSPKQASILNMVAYAQANSIKNTVIQAENIYINSNITISGSNVNLIINNNVTFINPTLTPININITTNTLSYKQDRTLVSANLTISVNTVIPCEYPLSMFGSKTTWATLENADYNGRAIVYGGWLISRNSDTETNVASLKLHFALNSYFDFVYHTYTNKTVTINYTVEDNTTGIFRGYIKNTLLLDDCEHKLSYWGAYTNSKYLTGEYLVDDVINVITKNGSLTPTLYIDSGDWDLALPAKTTSHVMNVEFINGATFTFVDNNMFQYIGNIINKNLIFKTGNVVHESGPLLYNSACFLSWWGVTDRSYSSTILDNNYYATMNAIYIANYNVTYIDLNGSSVAYDRQMLVDRNVEITNGNIFLVDTWTPNFATALFKITSGWNFTMRDIKVFGKAQFLDVSSSSAIVEIYNSYFYNTSDVNRTVIYAYCKITLDNVKFIFPTTTVNEYIAINNDNNTNMYINNSTFTNCVLINSFESIISNTFFYKNKNLFLPTGDISNCVFKEQTNLRLNNGVYNNNKFYSFVVYDAALSTVNKPYFAFLSNTLYNNELQINNALNVVINDNMFVSQTNISRLVFDATTSSFIAKNVIAKNNSFINNYTNSAYDIVYIGASINANGHIDCDISDNNLGGIYALNYKGTMYKYGIKVTIVGTLATNDPYYVDGITYGANVVLPTGWEILPRLANRYSYVSGSALACNNRKAGVYASGDTANNISVWGIPVFGGTSVFDVMITVAINDTNINNVSL